MLFDWSEAVVRWFAATRLRRILAVLLAPVWVTLMGLVAILFMLLTMDWEGDPGKLLRWSWTGSGDLKAKV